MSQPSSRSSQPLDTSLPLIIPHSTSTVKVHLINTSTHRTSPTSSLFTPSIPGFTTVSLPTWSFLITHTPSNKHILFDLGIRKDWETGFPPVYTPEILKGFTITSGQDVKDVLNSDLHGLGITISDIDAVIWSHHHFDHQGDITLFPSRTELVVGPGLRGAYSTYPGDEEGEIWKVEFEARNVRELKRDDFSDEIGGFPAHNFFGDGSFWVLSSPGHTVGHLSALARVAGSTGEENVFVFMAGDVAHHPGVFRPSRYSPLPTRIELGGGRVYDGEEIMEKLHPRKDARVPFLDVDEEPMCYNHEEALESVRRLQVFDADERVLVCIAHDAGLGDVLPQFPESLNGWLMSTLKDSGARNKIKWKFLEDFGLDGCGYLESA